MITWPLILLGIGAVVAGAVSVVCFMRDGWKLNEESSCE